LAIARPWIAADVVVEEDRDVHRGPGARRRRRGATLAVPRGCVLGRGGGGPGARGGGDVLRVGRAVGLRGRGRGDRSVRGLPAGGGGQGMPGGRSRAARGDGGPGA